MERISFPQKFEVVWWWVWHFKVAPKAKWLTSPLLYTKIKFGHVHARDKGSQLASSEVKMVIETGTLKAFA